MPPEGAIPAAFVISDCMVTKQSPQLAVIVKANGHTVAEWALGPDRSLRKMVVTLPAVKPVVPALNAVTEKVVYGIVPPLTVMT